MEKNNRYINLFQRTFYEFKLIFTSILFAGKYIKNNNFISLFLFRKSIEIEHTSPFRNFIKSKTQEKVVSLNLKFFGNQSLKFNLNDFFQMAICEEFIKYRIYNLDLLGFSPTNSIDCGAYRGYFSFLVDEKFPSCEKICIEPHQENYKFLTNVIKENKIKNIEVINKALSVNEKSVYLELWGSNLATNDNIMNSQYKVEVPSLNLFDLLNEVEKQDKLILKVDIEGSELDFFPSCIKDLPSNCAVFLETHDGWNSLKSIKETFIELGFSFEVLRDRGLYIDSFAQRIMSNK